MHATGPAPLAPATAAAAPAFELRGVVKRYGATLALEGVALSIARGEVVGLVGANGAGKSTLTRVLSGVTRPDAGELLHRGRPVELAAYGPRAASERGVRVVYQELSLLTNLDVAENFFVEQHGSIHSGLRWRRQLAEVARGALDAVFPGHGIDPRTPLAALSITQRQMVEIARAASTPGLELLILDEPTSSLGSAETAQLVTALARLTARGVAVLFISHRLGEVLEVADRVAVMRNGRKVWEGPSEEVDQAALVERMSGGDAGAAPPAATALAPPAPDRLHDGVYLRARGLASGGLHGVDADLRGGELVGVAGLEGSGQRAFLKALFFARRTRRGGAVARAGRVAFVSGDRAGEGVFPLWPVADNMTLGRLRDAPLFGRLDARDLAARARHWFEQLKVKAAGVDAPIVSLSGGNQQKVLVARALLAEADVILLDDPTKGVDVATKRQMAELFRAAAAAGKLVVWHSTEDEELASCSRVLVFRYGRVVKELAGEAATKARIVEASFSEPASKETLPVGAARSARGRRRPGSLLVPTAAMLAVYAVSGLLQPGVFSRFGVDLLLAGSIPLICAALAQMFAIGLSQIDLGVGAFMGLVAVICATLLHDAPSLGAGALVLTVVGYGAMGALVLLREVPAVIVTMGMSFVWNGLGYMLQDSPGGTAPEWLVSAFSLDLPVPESLLVVLLLGLAAHLALRSRYGTVLRGFGNNPAAVERSGWSPLKAVVTCYALASLFAIAGGVAIVAAAGASDVNSTKSYTLLTVAAVVMGGSELLGGVVSAWGTIVGAVTLSLVGSLIGLLRLNSSYVTGVQGAILLGILAVRLLRRART